MCLFILKIKCEPRVKFEFENFKLNRNRNKTKKRGRLPVLGLGTGIQPTVRLSPCALPISELHRADSTTAPWVHLPDSLAARIPSLATAMWGPSCQLVRPPRNRVRDGHAQSRHGRRRGSRGPPFPANQLSSTRTPFPAL